MSRDLKFEWDDKPDTRKWRSEKAQSEASPLQCLQRKMDPHWHAMNIDLVLVANGCRNVAILEGKNDGESISDFQIDYLKKLESDLSTPAFIVRLVPPATIKITGVGSISLSITGQAEAMKNPLILDFQGYSDFQARLRKRIEDAPKQVAA